VSEHSQILGGGDHTLPADLAAAAALGGEMGRCFAEFDWAAHPLGSPQDWPASLRTAVSMTLASRFPMMVFLGAQDLCLVYNDASIPILGDRHPTALGCRGEQVWWDVWEQVGPMIVGVVVTGAAVWSENLQVTFDYQGKPQERYFTLSHSPLIGNDGATAGVVCTLTETTEKVLGERRMQLLITVAAVAMDSRTLDESIAAVVDACTDQNADAPFVAAYLSDLDGIALRGATHQVQSLLPPTLAELTDWDPATRSRGETHVIDGLETLVPGLRQVLAERTPEQALVLPIGDGATAGALIVGLNPRCRLDALYQGFCQLVADQLFLRDGFRGLVGTAAATRRCAG
jgi:hypothetical protein